MPDTSSIYLPQTVDYNPLLKTSDGTLWALPQTFHLPNDTIKNTPFFLPPVEKYDSFDTIQKQIQKSTAAAHQQNNATKNAEPNTILTDTKPSHSPKDNSGSSDWIIAVFIFSFTLIALMRFLNSKYLTYLFKSIIIYSVSNRLFREKSSLSQRVSYFMTIQFFISMGMFAFQIFEYYNIGILQYSGFFRFVAITLIIFAGALLYRLFFKLLGYIFNAKQKMNEYFYSVNLFIQATGIVLLPIIILAQYVAFPTYIKPHLIALSVLFIIYLLRTLRGIQIFVGKHLPIFYMILYLCALEILPLFIIAKFLGFY